MLYGWEPAGAHIYRRQETDKTMEKQNIRRVRRLYIGLFAMVVGMVLLNALSFFRGAAEGMDLSVEMSTSKGKPVFAVLDFNVMNGELFSRPETAVYTSPDSTVQVCTPGVYSYNVLVSGTDAREVYTPKVLFSYVLLLLGLFCQIAVFVLLFLILGSIRRSLRAGTVFSHKVIRYMKWLAWAVLLATILSDVATYLMHLNSIEMLQRYAPQGEWVLDAGVPVDSIPELFIGVVILFLAEVFHIGYTMSEEQKWTV